jgi:hypothetical protein
MRLVPPTEAELLWRESLFEMIGGAHMADETESTWENTVKNEVAEMAHQTRRSPENREIGSGADGWEPANKCGCRGVVEGLSSSMRWKKFLRWQCADGISMYSRFVLATHSA